MRRWLNLRLNDGPYYGGHDFKNGNAVTRSLAAA